MQCIRASILYVVRVPYEVVSKSTIVCVRRGVAINQSQFIIRALPTVGPSLQNGKAIC